MAQLRAKIFCPVVMDRHGQEADCFLAGKHPRDKVL